MDVDPVAVVRLFQAIVAKAASDCVETPTPAKTKAKQRDDEDDIAFARRIRRARYRAARLAVRPRYEARRWFLDGGRDFIVTCEHAGYNPVDVRERAVKLAKSGWREYRAKAA